MDIPEDDYNRILQAIEMTDSPVGIDAKKTHVLILHQLEKISQQLKKLDARVGKLES